MIALSPKGFQTFPQYTPLPCGSSMAYPCTEPTNLAIIPRMKLTNFPTLATAVALIVFALPCAAKTNVELKDAQGKNVGSIMLWQQGSGVAVPLHLHDLSPGEQAIHFP